MNAAPALSATAPLVEHVFRAMGTGVSLLLPADRIDAARLARRSIEAWDARFSRFRADSELSLLNATAGDARGHVASDELFDAVSVALRAARATDGWFDPLLGARLVELGYDRTFDDIPQRPAADRPEPWTPGRWLEIRLEPATRRIHLPAGTAVDLGGIAKGMAVDAALAVLVGAGVPRAAVNAGGDLAVHGAPAATDAWPILVEGAGRRVVTVRQGALATSTVLERRWRVGADARHHLLDTTTALPSKSGLVLVSVAAGTCVEAEVAAKVALLRGPLDGARFLETRGLAGLLVADDGHEWRVGAGLDAVAR